MQLSNFKLKCTFNRVCLVYPTQCMFHKPSVSMAILKLVSYTHSLTYNIDKFTSTKIVTLLVEILKINKNE